MSNAYSQLSTGNTFGDWIVATNALVYENNNFNSVEYHKRAGTLVLDDAGTSLSANGIAKFTGQIQSSGTGSSVSIDNNLTINYGQILISNNQTVGLQVNGQANVNNLLYVKGSGTGLLVSNNANIQGSVYITGNTSIANNLVVTINTTSGNTYTVNTTVTAGNTITNTLQSNVSINTATLSVTGTSYTNILQSNNSVNTATSYVANTSFTNLLQANVSINTATSSVVGTSYTNILQANTGTNTSTSSVVGTSYTNILQANTGTNTATSSVVGTSYTNILQANTGTNTATSSVVGTSYTNALQANATISVVGTSYTNILQANTGTNTSTSSVVGTSYTNALQANTSTNTATSSVVGTSYTNILQANTGANTTTLSVVGTSYTNILQANTGANTTTLSVVGTSYTNVLQANASVNTTTLSVTNKSYTNLIQANTNITSLGNANTTNDMGIGGNLYVTGNETITGTTTMTGKANTTNDLGVGGNLYVTGTTTHTGATTMTGKANTTNDLGIGGNLYVTGHTTFEGITSTGATGTGNLVYSASPTLTGTAIIPNITLSGSFGSATATGTFNTISANSLTLTGATAISACNSSIVANSAIIGTGGLSIAGNFTINGSTIYNSPNFVLGANTPNQYVSLIGYRSGTNAAIQWNQATSVWTVLNVNNSNYYRILSDEYANGFSNLQSSTNVATSYAVANANTFLQSFTNSNITANATTLTTNYSSAISSNVATLNGSITSNVATLNGSITSNVATINGSITSNVSTLNSTISTANTNLKAYADGTLYAKSGGTISGDVNITGNLAVGGTTAYVNTAIFQTVDSLIELAANNTSDAVDIGFYGQYNSSGTKFTGLVRTAASNYTLFQGLTSNPTTNSIGTITSTNFATLNANHSGNVSGLCNPIGVADGGTGTNSLSGVSNLIVGGGTSPFTTLANNTSYSTGSCRSSLFITTDNYGRVTCIVSTPIPNSTGLIGSDASVGSFSITNFSDFYNSSNGAIKITSSNTSVITSTVSGNTVTINPITSGVTAGIYGSATCIPSIRVDAYGRVQSISTSSVSSTLPISGTTGTGSVSLVSQTLQVTANAVGVIQTFASGSTVTVNSIPSGVTSGTYGSSTCIPSITVDTYGRITSAVGCVVSTTVGLCGTTGTGASFSGGGTLTITGANGVAVAVSGCTATICTPQTLCCNSSVTFGSITSSGSITLGTYTSVGSATCDSQFSASYNLRILTNNNGGGTKTFTFDTSGNLCIPSCYVGSGAGLTCLPAANVTGTLSASGAGLTCLPAGNVTGTLGTNVTYQGNVIGACYGGTGVSNLFTLTISGANRTLNQDVCCGANPSFGIVCATGASLCTFMCCNAVKTSDTYLTLTAGSGTGTVASYTFYNNGTFVAPTVCSNNGVQGAFVKMTGSGYNSIATFYSCGNNGYGGTNYHTFLTATNTGISCSKHFRINPTGSFEIVNSAYTTPIYFFDDIGNFTAACNITAYSDCRLKCNITTIPCALNTVNALRGVSYDKDGQRGIGVIAQEIQQVLPEVVHEGDDENKTLSVAYGNISGVLIEAIKELTAQVNELKAEIEELKKK